jgi:signal transduction histidine kinase
MGKARQDHIRIAFPTGQLEQTARYFHAVNFTRSVSFLFILLGVGMALPGVVPFARSLQTVCGGAACLVGQLTPLGKLRSEAFGFSISEYAFYVAVIHFSADLLLILVAALAAWRKPALSGAIAAVFFLTALGTSNLILAAAQDIPALLLPGQVMQTVQYAALVPLFALLPGGHFRQSWLLWVSAALVPLFILPAFGLADPTIGSLAALLAVILVFASLMYSYQKGSGTPVREAAAWALASAGLLASTHWMGNLIEVLPLPTLTMDLIPVQMFGFFSMFGFLLLVGGLTCIAVILLGDELFRVDVVLSRAVVYSLLTLFVIASYVLIVGYLSLVFQSVDNFWLSLLATGIVAALFHPLRERVQRFVNRMIYGERDDPYTVITQLGQRLETIIASDEVIPTILSVVREALKVSYVAIALSPPQDGVLAVADEDGLATPVLLTLPLMVQNEMVGQLKVGPRQGESSFSQADRHLLEGLARQAGAAIHAARLNTDLQRARERLVIAQEEERRRIRRDLHDGLGASLAALNLQAGEIQRLMRSDLETASERIGELRAGLRGAIGDIRRVVYGLRPPSLDELGLLEALRSRIAPYQGLPVDALSEWDGAGSLPVQICFDAPDQLPPLQAAVEVALYRIVEEGLANVIHHARAKHATIALAVDLQDIRVMIQDDGEGMPEEYRPGVGLRSMRERTAELGGRMTVRSAPGQGTQICVWLPLFSGKRELQNVE